MNELHPVEIAHHWPWIADHLDLRFNPSMARALRVLAEAQNVSLGAHVPLGRADLAIEKLSRGEAQRLRVVLLELEQRGVVEHRPGRGRSPHVWSFTRSIERWRSMPWIHSAKSAVTPLLRCRCRAAFAVVARFPGHSVGLSREDLDFDLPSRFHLSRPGLLPVETRDNGEGRATTANSRAWEPVETRDNGEESGPLYLSSRSNSSSLREEEDQIFQKLRDAVKAVTGKQVWGGPLEQLRQLARAVDPGHADRMAAELRTTGIKFPKSAVELLESMALEPVPADPVDRAEAHLSSVMESRIRALELAGEYEEAASLRQGLDSLVS